MENIWKERNIDLWSLNHLIFGCTLAILMRQIGIDFSIAIFLAIIIFLVWEIIELYTKVSETIINRFSDVIFETLGFIVFYKIIFSQTIYLLIIISFCLLEISGYYSKIKDGEKDKLNYLYIFIVILYSIFNTILLLK